MLNVSKDLKVVWGGKEIEVRKYSDEVITFMLSQRRGATLNLAREEGEFNLVVIEPMYINKSQYIPTGKSYCLKDDGAISVINLDKLFVTNSKGKTFSFKESEKDARQLANIVFLKANGYL